MEAEIFEKFKGLVQVLRDSASNELQEETETFLNLQNLTAVWHMVLRGVGSQAESIQVCQTLLRWHRVLSNSFRGSLSLSSSEYDNLVVQSLLESLQDSFIVDGWTMASNLLPTSSLGIVFRSLKLKSTLATRLFRDTSVEVLLRMAQAALMETSPPENSATDLFDALAVALVKICPPQKLVDSLIMRRCIRHEYMRSLIAQADVSLVVQIVDTLGAVWGQAAFLSRGDSEQEGHFTSVILECLLRLDRSHLLASGGRGVPLLVSLTTGVSAHLDSSHRSTRIGGMKVAKQVSLIMGVDVSFEEMESEEPSIVSSASTAAATAVVSLEADAHPDNGRESDCDSDELEALRDDSITPLIRNRVVYLRKCMDGLQQSEGRADAYESLKAALEGIPGIVSAKPVDGEEVCPSLLRELLRLTNSFNMEGFDGFRDGAILCLLEAYPSVGVPTLTWALQQECFSIGDKINVVAILVKCSYVLAGVNSGSSSTTSTPAIPETSSGKTTIKRPKKLQISKAETSYSRNKFAPLAPHFFYPILSIVLRYVKGGEIHGKTAVPLVDLRIEPLDKSVHMAAVEEGDGIDAWLPARALLALAAFVRCSINTTVNRTLVRDALAAASQCRDVGALVVRRAALAVMKECVEALAEKKSQSLSMLSDQQGSVQLGLNHLLHLSSPEQVQEAAETESMAAVAAIADWASAGLSAEPDQHCRIVKAEIVRLAIDYFE